MDEWIHTQKNQQDYAENVDEICNLYRHASTLKAQGVNLVSVDEKTGIQALERKKISPMKPGQPLRQDNEYKRHGTQCLIANLEIATGKVICPTVQDTRTELDFLEHIKRTVETDPDAEWIFVADQLNTHKSESLVLYIAEKCSLQGGLGKKGKYGILKDMSTRMEFLADKSHKIRFAYTPKHASWLNQIECWFSIISRQLIKRLSVDSKDVLRELILSYIEYYNRVSAKPFKWLYSRKDQCSA